MDDIYTILGNPVTTLKFLSRHGLSVDKKGTQWLIAVCPRVYK